MLMGYVTTQHVNVSNLPPCASSCTSIFILLLELLNWLIMCFALLRMQCAFTLRNRRTWLYSIEIWTQCKLTHKKRHKHDVLLIIATPSWFMRGVPILKSRTQLVPLCDCTNILNYRDFRPNSLLLVVIATHAKNRSQIRAICIVSPIANYNTSWQRRVTTTWLKCC